MESKIYKLELEDTEGVYHVMGFFPHSKAVYLGRRQMRTQDNIVDYQLTLKENNNVTESIQN